LADIKAAFKAADLDKSGMLDLDEFCQLYSQ
jgi:Ca2+-binding EF-hand superfamily protein